MDQSAPPGHPATKPLKPARVALNVLALCFTLSVFGRGPGESFTVFLKPISESFGWDRAEVVSVYSLAALAGGLAAPLIGRLFDRSGPRSVYSLGLLLLGGAFLVAAHSQHLWQFQLSLGLCVGTGLAFFFTAIGMYAISPQVVAYLIEAGYPPLQAATAWGFSGIVLLFGMLGVSWLDGIIGRRPSVLFSYAVSIAGIVMLWLLQWYPNFWLLSGFVICFGSMSGSRGPLL